MTLVWEQEGENSGGFWGLYDDGNFVGVVYPLGDCFRWRDEVSNARRIEPSLAAARSACQARYEGEKALLIQRGQWPPRWLPWNDREDQAAY
jgi:hypothetical protein